MNKVWFIFRGDHHLGPFSVREILRMYEEGKITGQTLLWAEGDSGWKALHLQDRLVEVRPEPVAPKVAPKPRPKPKPVAPATPVAELKVGPSKPAKSNLAKTNKDLEELPPDLPPLPETPPIPIEVESEAATEIELPIFHPADLNEVQEEEEEIDLAVEETELEIHPPFVDLLGDNEVEEVASAPSEEEIDDFYEDRGANKKGALRWRWPLRALSLLMIVGLTYQVFFTNVGPFKFGGLSLRRLPGLSRDIEQQLHRFARENRGEFKVTLALGHKGQVIWLSSGLLGQGMMRLRLTSKEGELLGQDIIEAEASAPYYGGAALFDSFKFIRGQGLIPGRYEAYLTYRPNGFWDGVTQRWETLIGKARPLNQVLKFTYLYYLGANDQFDQALADYKGKLVAKEVKAQEEALAPLKLRLEFQSTLKELADKLMKLYEDELAKMKRGQDISAFTTRYAKDIEPLYRPLTLESKAKMDDGALSIEQQKIWEELHQDYRSLGDLVSDMQSMTSKRKSLNQASKDRLLRIFQARSSEIAAKAEAKVAEIMELIGPAAN